jgi:hypothetical protein
MLPNGSVVVQKRVHPVEITAIQWIREKKQVVSSATNGNILITRYDTLDVLFKLNHWRGVQSVSNAFFQRPGADDDLDELLESTYSVPLSLRSFFYGNEIERLMRIFGQTDTCRCGSIPLSKLPLVLEQAFPTTVTGSHVKSMQDHSGTAACDEQECEQQEMITFASLLEILRDSLTALQDGKISKPTSGVSTFDTHAQLFSLVSGSSSDGLFCVWNVKNGAVVDQGNISHRNQQQPSSLSISRVKFLSPYPYFMCTEEGSSDLTFWSTIALPPLLPRSHQCFLRFPHIRAVQSESAKKKTDGANTPFFITETESPQLAGSSNDQDAMSKLSKQASGASILAVEWFCGGGEKETLVCVGDDQGSYLAIQFPLQCFAEILTLCARLSRLHHDLQFRTRPKPN